MARTAVSTHALIPGDPRRTIHFVIGRVVARRMGGDTPVGDDDGDSLLAWSATQDDPECRVAYAYQVSFAWLLLAFAFIVAMAVVGVPVRMLAGEAAGNAVLTACLTATMFCMAGCANVLWRMYYYVPVAKRLARRGQTNTAAYAAAMQRTLPRNTSLIFQTAIAILTLILAVTTG